MKTEPLTNSNQTHLSDCIVLEPKIFEDERGFFLESYNQKAIEQTLTITTPFVQDNHSHSKQYVLRGLHYQIQHPQGKLIRVVRGEVFDVVVDLRRSSPTFGKWEGYYLSEHNRKMLWMPPGFAHGFLVLSECADFLYKTTDYYFPEFDRCIRWDDPTLNINWPISVAPLVSPKDRHGVNFLDAETFA